MIRIRHLYPGGKIKALTFSYDDGVNFDKRMIEIFNQLGLKGTFNLSTGLLSDQIGWVTKDGNERIHYLNREEIPLVYEGHEVAVHGKTHAFWTAIPKERAIHEIWEDRVQLEKLVGYPIRGLAYPFSACNEELRTIAKALGMRYGRMTGHEDYFQLPKDPLAFSPTCFHTKGDAMERLQKFIRETFNTNAFFCLSGHSFDFANDGNWSLLEEFCSDAANREEVWYATCIQIFDYLDVLERLQYTADCGIVKNPSADSAWIEVEGKVVEVRGGETLSIGDLI